MAPDRPGLSARRIYHSGPRLSSSAVIAMRTVAAEEWDFWRSGTKLDVCPAK
jgi:hypothetical protein